MMRKEEVLFNIQSALNRPDQPWVIEIYGNQIVAYWKWMDAMFFAPGEVNEVVKKYKFIVTLNDDGKWTEMEQKEEDTKNVNLTSGKIGVEKSFFAGKTMQKSFTFGVGKNNNSGETGVIRCKFDTEMMKTPIRRYLEYCGWKKKGFWG